MTTSRTKRSSISNSLTSAVAILGATTLLAACGQVESPPGAGGEDPPTATSAEPGAGADGAEVALADGQRIVEPSEELATRAFILQREPDEPMLCHNIMESYPPQCSGPAIVGDLDWEALENVDEASGVRWGEGYAVGTYDAQEQTFTLTRPVSTDPPQGWPAGEGETAGFPQLCEDGGGDPDFDPDSEEGLRAMEELTTVMTGMDGYVGHYVSDGRAFINLVVTSDAAEAEEQARAVWPGELCVEQRADVPTESQISAAQQAVTDSGLAPETLLSWGGSGVEGVLDVQVMVTDQDTVDRILEATSEHLDPQHLRISGVLHPLEP